MTGSLIRDWKEYQLNELISLKNGNAIRKEEMDSFGTYPVYGANGVIGYYNKYNIEHRTITIGRVGSCGEVNIIKAPAWISDNAMFVSTYSDLIDFEFIFFLLKYLNLGNKARKVAMPSISQKPILNTIVSIPSIFEQCRIVARIKECLDRVDEIKNLKEKSLNDVKRLLDSFYQKVISDEKKYVTVGEVILHTQNGRSIRQSNENPNGRTLTLSAVHDVELNHQQSKNVVIKNDVIEKFSFKKGDVFVSRSNTIDLVGLSSISEEDSKDNLIYPDLLIKLVPNTNKILPKYLTYALRYPNSRQQIRSKSRGTSQSMVKISSSSLKEVLIPLPSLIDQEKLVQKFDKFRILVNTLKMTFNETDFDALKKAILQKAFSGEL